MSEKLETTVMQSQVSDTLKRGVWLEEEEEEKVGVGSDHNIFKSINSDLHLFEPGKQLPLGFLQGGYVCQHSSDLRQ